MSDTSLRFDFLKGRDTASPHMRTVAANSTAMANRIRISGIISTAATIAMVAGFAALGAQGVALISALSPLIGLLGLLPSMLFATLAGVATLAIGISGLGAALKRTGGGASGASQAIAAAERRIETAQRSATQAQRDLNDARQTAADRLADITRELNRAHLDERGAVLSVADAQRALREARMSGDRAAIAHAQLNYEEAIQSLEEIRARVQDVTEEEEKRRTQGVEGSDEVQTALQRQADALRDLADAQAALRSAGSGGGGVDKAAEAYAKLSMAGKQLVDVLRSLGPRWQTVQRSIQQATFAGVGHDVQVLANAWLPVLQTRLGEIGKGWNLAFRGSAQMAASKGFVADMNMSLGNMAQFWQRIGRSFAPFLSGFRHFTLVGSTFLPGIGDWVLRIAERFDRWASAARTSGRAHDWIAKSLVVLDQTWQVLKNLGRAIGGIFRAGSGGPDWMPGLVAGTQALSDWINSPAGQGKLAAVFTTLRDIGSQMWRIMTDIGPALLDLFSAGGAVSDTFSVFNVVMGFAANHLADLAEWLPTIIGLYIAYKAVTAGAIVVEALRLPIMAASIVSNFALTGAMRANTAALLGQEVAQRKGIIAMAAAKVAGLASLVWLGLVTAAQWLWNIAMAANPIGLIIIAVAALVVGFIYLWNHSEGFRKFFIGMWEHIWSFLKMIGAWFAGPFARFFVDLWHSITSSLGKAWQWIVDKFLWLVGLPARTSKALADGARGMWNGLVTAFKAAINWMIRLWNDFHLTLGGGSVLGISIPSVTLDTPNIPYLDTGGDILRTGLAVVHEGERVLPAQTVASGNGKTPCLIVDFRNVPASLKNEIRKIVRTDGGGSVQIAFGP